MSSTYRDRHLYEVGETENKEKHLCKEIFIYLYVSLQHEVAPLSFPLSFPQRGRL